MRQLITLQSNSISDLDSIASQIKNFLSSGSIIFLEGELGAGKTTFVSYFCKQFSIKMVQSPTYAIHQRYSHDQVVIDHFDLYRLETAEQIESSGFFDLLEQPSDYAFVEWWGRVPRDQYPIGRDRFLLTVLQGKYELFDGI